jgi:hypothetical protein
MFLLMSSERITVTDQKLFLLLFKACSSKDALLEEALQQKVRRSYLTLSKLDIPWQPRSSARQRWLTIHLLYP